MSLGAAPQTLRTPRLTLRALRHDDAPALAHGVGNYDVARWLGGVPYPYDLSDARMFLDEVLGTGTRVWAICHGDALIGLISYTDELGYWLARSAWGRGFATEAGDAVIDHMFASTDLATLVSGHYAGNARSASTLAKLGFLEAGTRQVEARALSQTVTSVRMEQSRSRWTRRRNFKTTSKRLVINGVLPSDAADMQRLAGVPEVARMLLSVPVPWPDDAAQRWVESAIYKGRPGFRATIRLRDGTPIGGLGLGRAGGAGPMTAMYWLGVDHWGQGYATEAMRAFLSEVYERFGELDVIEADHFTDNPASGNVLRKLGFTRACGETGLLTGNSAARLEPAPVILYRVTRNSFRAVP